jgi:hypothetical protein
MAFLDDGRTWWSEYCPEYLVDIETALSDARQAHAYVSRELQSVETGSLREYCLRKERERLAGIAWRFKREMDLRDGLSLR